MKPWRETGENENLEECPCCLRPADGYFFACEQCVYAHIDMVHFDNNVTTRFELSAIGDRLYADEPVWGVWAVEAKRWCQFDKAGETYTQARAEHLAAIERTQPMACGWTLEVRRRIPAPEVGAKAEPKTEDEKVWGVWLVRAPGIARPGWCVDGSQWPFDERPATFCEASTRAASLRFARPLAEYEVRRIDDPRCSTAVACATLSTIPSGSALVVRDGKLVAEQPPPPLDAIPLADLARALFDTDETVVAFLDTKSEGDPKRRARNRQTAWARDEGGARTRALATVERIRAMRRTT